MREYQKLTEDDRIEIYIIKQVEKLHRMMFTLADGKKYWKEENS